MKKIAEITYTDKHPAKLTKTSSVLIFTAATIWTSCAGGGYVLGIIKPSGILWSLLAALVIVVPVHEGAHALAMLILGRIPKFGAYSNGRVKMLYTTFAGQNTRASRNTMVAILAAPQTVSLILLLASLGMPKYLMFAVTFFSFNLVAGSADMWMATELLKFPASTVIDDLQGIPGVAIYDGYHPGEK